MLPQMSPKALASAMKRMGIQQEEVPAEEVVIRLKDCDLIFAQPNLTKINMMGQETYQLIGHAEKRKRSTAVEISEEDIKAVMEQAKADRAQAHAALQRTNGDIAQAIIDLTS